MRKPHESGRCRNNEYTAKQELKETMYIYGEIRIEEDMHVCAFHLWRRPEHPEETL